MLLDEKIAALILPANKAEKYDTYLSSIISVLENEGKVDGTNMLNMHILYHLLEQEFDLDYLNLELYKKLQHLQETVTDYIPLMRPSTSGGTADTLPRITITPSSFSFTPLNVGIESVPQSYFVTGIRLVDSIKITGSSNFLLCDTVEGTYSTTLTLAHVGGTIVNKEVFVKFKPSAVTDYSLSITHTSQNAATVNLTVTGSGAVIPTIMTLNPTSIVFPSRLGTDLSTPVAVTVTVQDMKTTGNVWIYLTGTNSTRFEVCKTIGGTYTSTLNLDSLLSGGDLSTTIYVKFIDTVPRVTSTVTLNAGIHTTGDVSYATCTLYGEVINQSLLTPSITSLDFGQSKIGEEFKLTYTLNGTYLVDDTTISVPIGSGYEISLDDVIYSDTLTIVTTPTISQLIYVKFSPIALETYSTAITHESSTAVTKYVSLEGESLYDTIVVTPDTLTFANTLVGEISAEQQFYLEATDLVGNLLVSVPSGYQISKTTSTGFTNMLVFVPTAGAVAETVFVRFEPSDNVQYDLDITCSSSDFVSKTVSCSGLGQLEIVENYVTPTEYTTIGDGIEWETPVGISEVLVECYGYGGGSADASSNSSSCGGAGGSYAAKTIINPSGTYRIFVAGYVSVSIFQTYTCFVTGGTPTSGVLVNAVGGESGTASTPGIGSITGCVGDTVYAGGSGAFDNYSTYGASGGGGCAGPNGAGADAVDEVGGAGNGDLAGNGASGPGTPSIHTGVEGSSIGGGGSGACYVGTGSSNGALRNSGAVVITYRI